MDIVVQRCAGLDIHKKLIMACVLLWEDGRLTKHLREFGTTTRELLALSDWLAELGVTQLAMESTGVFWKPIFNILEDRFTMLLCNAQHIKRVPGRKTDVSDCEWIAQLLQHGLLSPSFVPERPVREFRELTRQRTSLVDDQARVANRIQKVLEDANIKLSSVATDTLGVSGRQMIRAMIEGEQNAEKLANMAKRRLRKKLPELREALQGQVREHHRFMLKLLLEHYEEHERLIERLSAEIERVLTEQTAGAREADGQPLPFAEAKKLLMTIPGIGEVNAENILVETGTDMGRFPTEGHLASWAGMCPGSHESAGKRKRSKTRKGNRWLRRALVQSAHSAGRTKQTYLSAQYGRLSARKGRNRAGVAVGHTLLTIIYHVLKTRKPYEELGADFLEQLNQTQKTRYYTNRLKSLGFEVILQPLETAA